MSGMDRTPAAPDAPPLENPAAGAHRGVVLADAPTRQRHALAYRAVVEAVYPPATTSVDASRAGDSQPPAAAGLKRPDMAEKYPERYARPADPAPRVDGPGEHPAGWIDAIYPGRTRPERPNNCGECARAVDSTWHGQPAVAAELANRRVGGERPAVMAEWAGQPPQAASMADIGRRLRELGPGSSAVVGFDRADAPGHWFNAVNHEGTVLAVDGQGSRFEEWPPSKDGLGFDESGMSQSDAIYFTADGKVVRNDHQ